MPKIIIREYDNTTAGNVDYANFSVVVPGLVKTGKWKDASGKEHDYGKDENDKSVFDENDIYECSSKTDFEKYIGKVAKAKTGSCATYIVPEHTITEEEFNGIYKGKVCSFEIITVKADQKPGKYKVHNDLGWFKLAKVETYVEEAAAQYTIIDYEGSDDIEQNGNQIAYELLGLGYTIYYKKLDAEKIGSELEDSTFWECLKDKSIYNFRYVCTGGFYDVTAYNRIYDLVNKLNTETLESTDIPGRGDAIALIDVDETGFKASSIVNDIKGYVKKLTLGKYAAVFCPQVTYAEDKDAIYDNLTFPASFHYLACAAYARNELNFNEWYAVAGYTRGICNKAIAGTSFKLGEIAINALQPRTIQGEFKTAVNLITNIRGTYYVWGNRTAFALEKDRLRASHFLNIRQLCCTLKKEIYGTCRKLTFNPNSDILWGDFCNAIKPILEKMKADQGISNYKIIKVKESRKALLTAKIRIVPIEAVEDFDISIFLEDSITGVTIGTEE